MTTHDTAPSPERLGAEETALDIDRLADAIHAKVCGPFATIDPQECVYGRGRDVILAIAVAAEYDRLRAALATPVPADDRP